MVPTALFQNFYAISQDESGAQRSLEIETKFDEAFDGHDENSSDMYVLPDTTVKLKWGIY